MELVVKRTLILLMLIATFLLVGLAATSTGNLSLGHPAYAGEDEDDDDTTDTLRNGTSNGSGGSGDNGDNGGSPSGGVNTGGGGTAGTAGSDASALPIALGGLGALAGGTLLLRRFARQDS